MWINGIVTVGEESLSADLSTPTQFPTNVTDYILAPLWTQQDTIAGGYVAYEIHSSSSRVVRNVNAFIQNRRDSDFEAEGLLLVAWNTSSADAGMPGMVSTGHK